MNRYYFAYGSNMRSQRLEKRVPGSRNLGRRVLFGWKLVCNKVGADGSAKANIVRADEAQVWGVLYELAAGTWDELDRIEGGYERMSVEVSDDAGATQRCEVYRSDRITDDTIIYAWYKELMVAGARENELPESHVELLRALPSREAPDDVGDRRGFTPKRSPVGSI